MKKRSKKALLFSSLIAVSFGMAVAGTVFAKASEGNDVPLINDKAYYVTGASSEVEYGGWGYTDVQGVRASLSEKSNLVFGNIIDLNEIGPKNTFIEVMPLVQKRGVADYWEMDIQVIDAYDAENYLTVRIRPYPNMENTSDVVYLMTYASNGQKPTGKERNSKNIHVNDPYGTWVYGCFSCREDITVINSNTNYIGLTYDVNENQLFCFEHATNKYFMVADLDDQEFFGSQIWDGFKNGKVYCSISCKDYQTQTANLIVKKYGTTDLTNPNVLDEFPPEITVDTLAYNKTDLPKAVVGKPYPIFLARSYDTNEGVVATDVSVYMNYYSSNKVSVSTKNGAFTPKMTATYYIEYRATDTKGNQSVEVLPVSAVSATENMSLVFENFVGGAHVGETYLLPSYSISGGSGNPNVQISASLDGEKCEIVNGGIKVLKTGTLEIAYSLKDYIGQTSVIKKQVAVAAADKLLFEDVPVFPKYLISGNTYRLPELYAYNYVTANGERVLSEISVKEGGTEKKITNGEYKVGNVDNAQIVYTAKVDGLSEKYETVIPVYAITTGDNLDMAKLFKTTESGTTDTEFTCVKLTANANASFEYLNVLSAISLNTEFKATATTAGMSKFRIVMTDYADPTVQVKFTYEFTKDAVKFYVNGHTERSVKVNVALKAGAAFALKYENADRQVYFGITSNKGLIVADTADGKPFEGFPSNRVYLTYEAEGIAYSASLDILSLGGQYFSDETADYIAPVISVVGSYGGEYVPDTVLTLPKFMAIDGVNGELDVKLTVTDPQGKTVVSCDGETLSDVLGSKNYRVTLSQYGQYSVKTSTVDANGTSTTFSFGIKVVDVEKPQISLGTEIVSETKVGEKVFLPKINSSDNHSAECTVKIYIFTPMGMSIALSAENDGFTPSQTGVYKIVYFVADEAGNNSLIVHTVTVKEN